MRVLMITQKIDPDDPLLGFTAGWVRALAARVDRLFVLTLGETRDTGWLPPNVETWAMGKGGRGGRLAMTLRLYRTLIGLRRLDAVFAHMVPRYAWMAAPITTLRRVPLVMWYTHRQISFELRLALAASKRVVTAVPDSFPLIHPKVDAIGHGIDSDFFAPSPDVARQNPPLILHVARIVPIKFQHTVIEALGQIPDLNWQMAFVGLVPPGGDTQYLEHLRARVAALGLEDRVQFTGGLTPDELRGLYRRASIALNVSPRGLFDKAALESMMAATPTIVTNAAFDPVLGADREMLHAGDPENAEGLAQRLYELLHLHPARLEALGAGLRARAVELHSLGRMMDRLVGTLAEVGRGGPLSESKGPCVTA